MAPHLLTDRIVESFTLMIQKSRSLGLHSRFALFITVTYSDELDANISVVLSGD